jgi:hypothetical protein
VHHAVECTFVGKEDAHRRMTCQCPMQARLRAYLWLVDPRHLEVEGDGGTPIRHGNPPAAYILGEALASALGPNGCT